MYPGLSESEVDARGFRFRVYFAPDEDGEGYAVLQHGIGSSAFTFALFVEQLRALNPKLGVLTYDVRHHGFTEASAGGGGGSGSTEAATGGLDLSVDTLVDDLAHIVQHQLVGATPPPKPVHVLLLGHSMGGTVAARFARRATQLEHVDVRGLVVVDAVEGYAKQALASMHSLLNIWPHEFGSAAEAVRWELGMGKQLRNAASAEISVPPLLTPGPGGRLVWKLDLRRTERFWDSWFADLDELFLQAPAARLLVLAGVGRLDTALTRGQMQGKFQMLPVPEAGHYIHEDAPHKVAQVVHDFWQRNGKPITIVPKFGQLRQPN